MLTSDIQKYLPLTLTRDNQVFQGATAGNTPFTVKGVAGQTANVFQVQNSAGTNLLFVDPSGNLTIAGTASITINEALTGNLTLTGTLAVTGSSTLSTLTVTGLTTLATSTQTGLATYTGGITTTNGAISFTAAGGQTFTVNMVSIFNSNVTINTLSLLTALGVSSGGTGATKFTTNGVLYGQGTSPILATAQGPANSVLTANAGAPSFSQTPTINTSLTIGVAGSQAGTLLLKGGTSGTVTTAVAAAAGTWTLTLPTSGGSSGQTWTTDGTGVMTFGTLTVGGGGTGNTTNTLNGVLYGNGSSAVQATAQGGTNTVLVASGGAPSFSGTVSVNNSVSVGNNGSIGGTFKILGFTSGTVTLSTANAAGTWTLQLPTSGGTANLPLITDGTGIASWTILPLAGGGSNAALTASNGGIVWSNASQFQILSGTATANQVLLSGSNATPTWSTATYPATTTVNQILYSSSANVVGGITTANSAILNTNGAGVPLMTASPSIATSVTCPLLIGGGGAGSSLTLQSTSGVGTTDFIAFQTASQSERMRILNSGSVGIGVTALTVQYAGFPEAGDVIQEIAYGTATANDTPYAGYAITKNLTGTSNLLGTIAFANTALGAVDKRLGHLSVYTDGATNKGSMRFFVNNGGTETERMRIISSGNVGIGVTPSSTQDFRVKTLTAGDTAISIEHPGNTNNLFTVAESSGNAILQMNRSGAQNDIQFATGSANNNWIASGAAFLINSSTAYGRLTQRFEVNGTTADYGGAALSSWSGITAALAPILDLNRSRGTSGGTYTAVANGDATGYVTFRGSDGSAFQESAQIWCEVDNTVAANQVPGRMKFLTANSAGTKTEAMRIDSAQRIGINITGASLNERLMVNGAITTNAGLVNNQTSTGILDFASGGARVISYGAAATNGIIFFNTGQGGAASSERFRIDTNFVLNNLGANSANVTTAGSIICAGFSTTDVLNASFTQASHGTGTVTYFIGNASITTVSDVRVKENIRPTTIDALDMIKKMNVVDFQWKEGTTHYDSYNGNGMTHTGMIAQELKEIMPFVVNTNGMDADGELLPGHEWKTQYELVVPTLVKALQQLTHKVEVLETQKV